MKVVGMGTSWFDLKGAPLSMYPHLCTQISSCYYHSVSVTETSHALWPSEQNEPV